MPGRGCRGGSRWGEDAGEEDAGRKTPAATALVGIGEVGGLGEDAGEDEDGGRNRLPLPWSPLPPSRVQRLRRNGMGGNEKANICTRGLGMGTAGRGFVR